MKKITTNGRSFGTAQSLTRQQLKNVMGGSATPTTKKDLLCSTKDCFATVNGETTSAICTTPTTGTSCICPLGNHFCG